MKPTVRKHPEKDVVLADVSPTQAVATISRAKSSLPPRRGSGQASPWNGHRPNYHRGLR